MTGLELLFWSIIALLFYTYLGYGLFLWGLVQLKRIKNKYQSDHLLNDSIYKLPSLTLIIPAYNELECLGEKVANSLSLDYPKHQLKLIFVTDGSTDGSEEYLAQFQAIQVYHQAKRAGKIAAINRVMNFVETEIVVFSDANALLNREALLHLVKHFENPLVGCVAGEKRIAVGKYAKAATAGEGLYWRYESQLKKWSYELNSTIGAAGELWALRTNLFEIPPRDTILDDFIMSLSVVSKGYKIAYTKEAYAMEKGSLSLREEMKRKVRICGGGIQAMLRTQHLLSPLRHPLFAFQYFSHRCLRWSIAPLGLLLLIPIHAFLVYQIGSWYTLLGIFHLCFYTLALLGWMNQTKKLRSKLLYVPLYFVMMNVSALLGIHKFLLGRQSVLWEKSMRLK